MYNTTTTVYTGPLNAVMARVEYEGPPRTYSDGGAQRIKAEAATAIAKHLGLSLHDIYRELYLEKTAEPQATTYRLTEDAVIALLARKAELELDWRTHS